MVTTETYFKWSRPVSVVRLSGRHNSRAMGVAGCSSGAFSSPELPFTPKGACAGMGSVRVPWWCQQPQCVSRNFGLLAWGGHRRQESRRRNKAVRQLSGLRVLFCMLLFCLVSTSLSAPCPLKDHSSCWLVFHQWNVSPILCCLSSREGIVHIRRGLRPLHYHLHALRAPLLIDARDD